MGVFFNYGHFFEENLAYYSIVVDISYSLSLFIHGVLGIVLMNVELFLSYRII